MLIPAPKKNILIKTFTFESGLWYLAKSLGQVLRQEGHQVFYLPKSRYILNGKLFRRSYPQPSNSDEFSNQNILIMSDKKSIAEQIAAYIQEYKIDIIISFETLMEKSSWIGLIKKESLIKVIDVPMLEWVSMKFFQNRAYQIFNEIWGVTKITTQTFQQANYKAYYRVWDFVDRELFTPRF